MPVEFIPGLSPEHWASFPELDPARIVGRGAVGPGEDWAHLAVRDWGYDAPPFAWHGHMLWRLDEHTSRRREITVLGFRVRLWPASVVIYRPADRRELPPC